MWPQLQSYMPRTEAQCTDKEPCAAFPLYRQIWNDFIAPRAIPSSTPAKCSMVLYGPPGTGKTTFAEYLAAMLGWELITFSPSDFLERGDQGVEARAKVIFTALQELSDKVILFDEIDQLILDKKSTEWQRQEGMFKFMTPSMLVKLRTLRRAAKSIFIIATNYEYMIEPAAKRHGRIDDRILVLPPDKRYRQIFLAEQLRNRGE
jgi:SpoVK/Ycf46/Vps4 family AAA+-type ATPase